MSHRIRDEFGDNNLAPSVNQVRRGHGSGRRRHAPDPAPDSDIEEYRQMHVDAQARRQAAQVQHPPDDEEEQEQEEVQRGRVTIRILPVEETGEVQERNIKINIDCNWKVYHGPVVVKEVEDELGRVPSGNHKVVACVFA